MGNSPLALIGKLIPGQPVQRNHETIGLGPLIYDHPSSTKPHLQYRLGPKEQTKGFALENFKYSFKPMGVTNYMILSCEICM